MHVIHIQATAARLQFHRPPFLTTPFQPSGLATNLKWIRQGDCGGRLLISGCMQKHLSNYQYLILLRLSLQHSTY